MRKIFLFIIFCLISPVLFSADIEAPIEFNNARLTAMGGYHAALTDDVMTLFNNPAGMSTDTENLMVAQFTLGLTGPVFTIADAIIGGGGDDFLTDPAFLDLLETLYAATELTGPLSFAYVGNGLGLGIFSWTDVLFKGSGLNLFNEIMTNIMISGGYSFPIIIDDNNSIHIGLLAKALIRGQISATNSVFDVFNSVMSDPLSLVLGGDFVLSIGGGADMGILYTYKDSFSFGVTGRNLYTGTARYIYNNVMEFYAGSDPVNSTPEQGIVPLDLSAGVMWAPPLGFLGHYISDVVLLFDYVDILDFVFHPSTAKFWLLHFNLGLELRLLDVLSLRGGFSDGLLAAGLGLDLSIMQINVSMFGSEESLVPDGKPMYNLVLGLEFSL